MTGVDESTEVSEVPDGAESCATLVPIDDDGGFLVFGELPPSMKMDVEPVPYLRDEQVRGMADALAGVAGFGNLAVQGWSAYQGSVGLVRLAPETMAALKAGATPLTQNGWALGTLTKGGKFVAQVRWAPAAAAGVAPALAALGPAVALLAVQWQLGKISKAVERNIELTRTVLDELREEAWYELDAVARVVLDAMRTAEAVGEVTDLTWQYLQAQSTLPVLLKHRQRNLDALMRELDELSGSANQSEWFQKHYGDLLRHCQAVMTAQQAISLHQLMRMAHARRTGDPRDELMAQHVLRVAQAEHEAMAERIDASLRTVYRSIALLCEANPGRRFPVFGSNDVELPTLRDAAKELHARAVAGPFRQLEPIRDPRHLVARHYVEVPQRDRAALEQRLRWVLSDDEDLMLLAKGSYRFGDSDERHLLAVTNQRALLIDSADLKSGRATALALPIEADLSRTIKDGTEVVEVKHEGHLGVLKTKAKVSVVFDALTALKTRGAAPEQELIPSP